MNASHLPSNDALLPVDFKQNVLESDLLVLVDFWAKWCGPCQVLAPFLDKLSTEPKFVNKLKIVKIDIDEEVNQSLVKQYNITSIPTLLLFYGTATNRTCVPLPSSQLKLYEALNLYLDSNLS